MPIDNRLIDAKTLARIARMDLIARQAVEGFLSGKHPSPFYGSSVEYADHRPYSLGDPIRTIDWKLLAKTDRYFIKLYEEQTNLRATILLDTSNSMAFGSESASKYDYGCMLAAALAYLLIRQNDAAGMAMFDREVCRYLPARTTAGHFRRILELMAQTRPHGGTHIGAVLHELAGKLKKRGLVILISDLLDEPAQIADGLAHLRYCRHEVIVFHLVDEAEATFPYQRLTRFRDAEGTAMVIANPHSMRKRYLQRLEDHLDQIKRSCMERGVSYQRTRTNEAFDSMLSTYLQNRSRIKKTAKV